MNPLLLKLWSMDYHAYTQGGPLVIWCAISPDLLSRASVEMELAQYPNKLSLISGALHASISQRWKAS